MGSQSFYKKKKRMTSVGDVYRWRCAKVTCSALTFMMCKLGFVLWQIKEPALRVRPPCEPVWPKR